MQKMKKCFLLHLALAALLFLCVTAFAAESAVEVAEAATEAAAGGATEAAAETAAETAADSAIETETGSDSTVETKAEGEEDDSVGTMEKDTAEDSGEAEAEDTAEDSEETVGDGAQQQDLTGGVVTEFIYESSFLAVEKQTYSYKKNDLADLFEMLRDIEEVLYSRVQLPNDEVAEAMCSAAWNTDDISLETAGNYVLNASLSPPEGCTFGEGVRTQVVLQVQILDESAPIQIIGMEDWNPYALALAVTQGSTVESITESQLFQNYTTAALRCEDENGGLHRADISWDFSSLNMSESGVYTILGTPVPPEGTVFAEGLVLAQPAAVISVQAAGRPDINCFYLRFPDILFPWISPPAGYGSVAVWLSGEDGVWQELTSVSKAGASGEEVWISTSLFTKGESYRVQVDYEGGQTGILSFQWDDTIVIDGYWEGDRDGDDGSGITPPGVIQPPPKPDSGNDGENSNGDGSSNGAGSSDGAGGGGDGGSSVGGGSNGSGSSGTLLPAVTPIPEPAAPPNPAPNPTANPISGPISERDLLPEVNQETVPGEKFGFMEEVTATSTTISGRRLRMMMEADRGLQFSKQGVSVFLSSEAVEALNIGEEDIFSIEILREGSTVFSFQVQVNGSSVTNLKDTKITLPYRAVSDEHGLALRHNETGTITSGSYEPQSGLGVFVVDRAGNYAVLEEETPPAGSDGAAQPEMPARSEASAQSEQAATQSEAAVARSKPAAPVLPVVFASGCLLTVIGGIWFSVRRSDK